jgi:uncharacterized glyoxalase superfamily protein PhnB
LVLPASDTVTCQQFRGLTPYLYYADADKALQWLTSVLGFGPSAQWVDETGAVQEAEIAVGDQKIAIGARAPGADEGPGQLLIIHLDDVDAYHLHVAAALGEELAPPQDQPYGPRTFDITDPWGYRWHFWQGKIIAPNG